MRHDKFKASISGILIVAAIVLAAIGVAATAVFLVSGPTPAGAVDSLPSIFFESRRKATAEEEKQYWSDIPMIEAAEAPAAPVLSVSNDKTLNLSVVDPNYYVYIMRGGQTSDPYYTSLELTFADEHGNTQVKPLKIKGKETPGKASDDTVPDLFEKCWSVRTRESDEPVVIDGNLYKRSLEYSVRLDGGGVRFRDVLEDLVPGDNITVTAKVKSETADGQGAEASVTLNSLFASSQSGTIEVANARHLQNLSTLYSGVTDSMTEVSVISDIDGEGKTLLSIVPPQSLEAVHGNLHIISGFRVRENGQNVDQNGLFVENTGNSETYSADTYGIGLFAHTNGVFFNDLFIEGLIVHTLNGQNAGSLVGVMNGGAVTGCGVFVPDELAYRTGSSLTLLQAFEAGQTSAELIGESNGETQALPAGTGFVKTGNAAAGGLIGLTKGEVTVSDCFASVPVNTVGGIAGGLVGKVEDGILTIDNSYTGGYVDQVSEDETDEEGIAYASYTGEYIGVYSDTGVAGGLVGVNGAGLAVNMSYSSASVMGITAGGIIGADDTGGRFSQVYTVGRVIGFAGNSNELGSFAGWISEASTFDECGVLDGVNRSANAENDLYSPESVVFGNRQEDNDRVTLYSAQELRELAQTAPYSDYRAPQELTYAYNAVYAGTAQMAGVDSLSGASGVYGSVYPYPMVTITGAGLLFDLQAARIASVNGVEETSADVAQFSSGFLTTDGTVQIGFNGDGAAFSGGIHFGDWPNPMPRSNFGMVYYERVDEGLYWRGYVIRSDMDPVDPAGYMGIDTYISPEDYEIAEENEEAEPVNFGAMYPFIRSHGRYVSEDGYLILIPSGVSASGVTLSFGSAANDSMAGIGDGAVRLPLTDFLLYSAMTDEMELFGYSAYVLDPQKIARAAGISIFEPNAVKDGAAVYISYRDRLCGKFSFLPFFADTIQIPAYDGVLPSTSMNVSGGSADYAIRSARQLQMLIGAENAGCGVMTGVSAAVTGDLALTTQYLGNLGDCQRVVEQQLDITFDRSQVVLTQCSPASGGVGVRTVIEESDAVYTSPTIQNLKGELRSVAFDLGGTMEYYTISHLRAPFVHELILGTKGDDYKYRGGGVLRRIRFSDVEAPALIESNSGTIEEVSLENCHMTGSGGFILVNEDQGIIRGCSIRNALIEGNGFVGENSGVIREAGGDRQNGIYHAVIRGNGFTETNGGMIFECEIVNARIGRYGFAENNTGTLANCVIYPDNEAYEKYTESIAEGSRYFTLNPETVDMSVREETRDTGYNLVIIGRDITNDSAWLGDSAGFVGNNYSEARAVGCSVTGKVYGGNCAAGFFHYNDGEVAKCYANTIVTVREPSGWASGFGTTHDMSIGNGYSRVRMCHALGELDGSLNSAGFIRTIVTGDATKPLVETSYTAVWGYDTAYEPDTYYPFYAQVVYPGGTPITGLNQDYSFRLCKYLQIAQNMAQPQASFLGLTSVVASELSALVNDPYKEYGYAAKKSLVCGQYTTASSYIYPMACKYMLDSECVARETDTVMTAYGDFVSPLIGITAEEMMELERQAAEQEAKARAEEEYRRQKEYEAQQIQDSLPDPYGGWGGPDADEVPSQNTEEQAAPAGKIADTPEEAVQALEDAIERGEIVTEDSLQTQPVDPTYFRDSDFVTLP